jgi:phage repressor protein C with HTH and peptisase S24 domain
MAETSRRLGRNPAYIQQFLERGSPKELPESVREALGPLLGVEPDQLRNTQKGTPDKQMPKKSPFRRPENAIPSIMTKDLPVLGAARGGRLGAGQFADNGEFFGLVDRPASLQGIRSAYAVFIVDDSMEPRYYAGEVAQVNPHKPCAPGSFVVVQTETPNGERDYLVKRLVRRTASAVRLAQFNPKKEFDVPAENVTAIHRIVGTTEDS